MAALKELRSRQQPVEPEPEPVRRIPETANVGVRRLNPVGLLVLGVAYGVMPPEALVSVELLLEALVHARGSAGHAREAELIADRLEELGEVVERPEPPRAPPEFSAPKEMERIVDENGGGLVQGPDGGWMTASDAAVLAAVQQADEDAMRGRVEADLRAAGLVSGGGGSDAA